jgi:hypothetical protein
MDVKEEWRRKKRRRRRRDMGEKENGEGRREGGGEKRIWGGRRRLNSFGRNQRGRKTKFIMCKMKVRKSQCERRKTSRGVVTLQPSLFGVVTLKLSLVTSSAYFGRNIGCIFWRFLLNTLCTKDRYLCKTEYVCQSH